MKKSRFSEHQIVNIRKEYDSGKSTVTVDAIKNSVAGKDDSSMSLCGLMEYHNGECADSLAQITMKKIVYNAAVC